MNLKTRIANDPTAPTQTAFACLPGSRCVHPSQIAAAAKSFHESRARPETRGLRLEFGNSSSPLRYIAAGFAGRLRSSPEVLRFGKEYSRDALCSCGI